MCLLVVGQSTAAQTVATLDFGSSVIEYQGFLVSGAAIVAPQLQYDSPNLSFGAQGTWVVFESGNQILQATAAAAWLTPATSPWRLELSGSIGSSRYLADDLYGHALARTRVHYSHGRYGAWVSGATGRSFGDFDAAALELAVGVWTVQEGLTFAGTMTAAGIEGDGYVDVVGVVRWRSADLQIDAELGTRPVGAVSDRRVYGELSARKALGDKIGVFASGGQYPSDPVRGVLAARYMSLGVRVALFGSRTTAPSAVIGAVERAARRHAASEHAGDARIEVVASGLGHTVRVYATGAGTVELMGDFTDWQPVRLVRTGSDLWEIQLPIPPGVHRLNIRIAGGSWLVPRGTRLEDTEFGNPVGVVIVP